MAFVSLSISTFDFCFVFVVVFRFCFGLFDLISPEFSYRPGLSVLSEDSNNAVPSHGAGGPPNRPLPPTPDDDDQQGDRTLIMKRVCVDCIICFVHILVSVSRRDIVILIIIIVVMCYAQGFDRVYRIWCCFFFKFKMVDARM